MGGEWGGPAVKRTELKRRTPLHTNTPLVRAGRIARSRGIHYRPAPKTADELYARMAVTARSGGRCEMRIPGVCLGRATNWCHRIAEGQGGPWLASNGIAGCGSGNATGCHGWTHQHPDLAKANGWIVPPTYRLVEGRRVLVPAAEFPMLLWDGRRVLLDDDGRYLDLPGDVEAAS